jgi:EmrB/QacA subfamily drug resistance transporter
MSAPAARASRHTTNPWVVLVLVCLAQFMIVLDATIVNIALPAIQRDLGFSRADLQWVINGYTLVFGGFLLLGGRAGDLIGRKRLFLIGMAIFSIASLLNGLSASSEQLVAFRALQGLGGALVSPVALSIITTTFSEGPDRTKALGVWGAIAAGGSAFGLLLGGILTDALSWEWIFFINVPIGIATFVASARLLPESRAERRPATFDVAGAVSVTAGLVVLVYAIVKADAWGWGSTNTIGLTVLAVVLLASFIAIEHRSREPLVPLGIFRIRTLATADGVFLFVAGGLFAMFFFSSLYAQQVLGYSPLRAGFAFLPVTAAIIVGSGAAQYFIKRFGPKRTSVAGMVVAAVGLFLLTGASAGGSYLGDLLPGLLLMAFGMGNVFVPMTLIATAGVDSGQAGLASGLFNTAQQVGGALGLAVLSTLADNASRGFLENLGRAPSPADQVSALVEGMQVAFGVGGALMLAGAVIAALLIRQRDVAHLASGEVLPVAA